MGEPSLPAAHILHSAPDKELETLVKHQFPGATIIEQDEGFALITMHSLGDTVRSCYENALNCYRAMQQDGESLPQQLNEIDTLLRQPGGMTRELHDSLMGLLDIAEQSLNAGVLTQTVPWIMVPSHTRRIDEMRRRVTTRLGMMAQEMLENQRARKRASEKPYRSAGPVPIEEILRSIQQAISA